MKVTRKRRIQKRTVQKGGDDSYRPLYEVSRERHADTKRLFANSGSIETKLNLAWLKTMFMTETKMLSTFKTLMIVFKEIKSNANFDVVNYKDFLKNLDITAATNKYYPDALTNLNEVDKEILNKINHAVKNNMEITQDGKGKEKDFSYEFKIKQYGAYVYPEKKKDYEHSGRGMVSIKEITIPDTTAIMTIFPTRSSWGKLNLVFELFNNRNVQPKVDVSFRIHDHEQFDKDIIDKDPLNMPYGMDIFKNMKIIFPPTYGTKTPNTSVEPPSEFVEESNPDIVTNQDPDPALDISTEAQAVVNISTNYEAAPGFENETLGGRRRRKTRKSRKHSKKTKKGRRRKSV